MFLNHIIGNLPACFQVYGLLIRNQTACSGQKWFLFCGFLLYLSSDDCLKYNKKLNVETVFFLPYLAIFSRHMRVTYRVATNLENSGNLKN